MCSKLLCLALLCSLATIKTLGATPREAYYYNGGNLPVTTGAQTWASSSALPLSPDTSSTPSATASLVGALDSSVPASTPIELFSSQIACTGPASSCSLNFNGLSGFYEVQLYLSDGLFGPASLGSRVMDVLVNGDKVLAAYDIFAEVGASAGVMKAFTVDASNGLSIVLKGLEQNPALSGLALIPYCSDVRLPLEDSCSALDRVHPADININLDLGGQGDGDVWYPSNGEYQQSFPQFNFFKNVEIDMSADNLPPGIPMSLFQSHAFVASGDLVFKIPLVDEFYNVTFFFAETTPRPGNPRIMDIEVEGIVLVEDFDVVNEAGANVALAKRFTVDVRDGALDIVIKRKFGNPYLCGLKVEKFVKEHDATFLHVVIDNPRIVVNQDGSGLEIVDFTGEGSHTHEDGQELLEYVEWESNGELVALSENVSIQLELGTHRLGLTIFDTKTPSESLYSSSAVTVAPLDHVPGVLIKSYLDPDGNLPLGGDLGTPEAGYSSEKTFFVAAEIRKTGRVYSFHSTLVVPKQTLYKFVPVGGTSSIVIVDGEEISTSTTKLFDIGVYKLEARFRVTNINQWPLSLLRHKGTGAARLFGFSELGYDLSLEKPIITSMSPQRGNSAGGQTVFIEGSGFSPQDELTVMWGEITISGYQLTISPIADELTFTAPASPPGPIDVRVVNPIGTSSTHVFFAGVDGPLPVAFSEPKEIFNMFIPGVRNQKPTRVCFGPDGRIYVGTFAGKIYVLTIDENYDVIDEIELEGVFGIPQSLILGLSFNPVQEGPSALYIAHGTINAQGGLCLEGRRAPYTGRVSLLFAPNYDKLTSLITGLPVSNHDHGINGMEFDTEGNLYVSVGGNTNAGIPACAIGELDESPLSASLVKAEVLKPGFQGHVRHRNRFTKLDAPDQTYGLDAEVVPGTDVEAYAFGFRNAYDLVFTQDGHLFLADNGPNKGYGLTSTSANTTAPDAQHGDEIVLIGEGKYYGHPNRNRGRTDPRQNVYYNRDTPSIPGVFEQCIQKVDASSNGMDEYRSNAFNGALRGSLVVQKLNSLTYAIELNEDRVTSKKRFDDLLPAMAALDVKVGPGGVLIAGVFKTNKIAVAIPEVDTTTSVAKIYDIYPYRAVKGRVAPFIVSGHGFSRLGSFEVFIGGIKVIVTNHTDRRVYGQLPTAPSLPVITLLDVEIMSEDGQKFSYTKGIQFLTGKPLNVAPRISAWEVLPDLPASIGEVVAAVLGTTLFVFGQGHPATMAFNLETKVWLPLGTYPARPNVGHHHSIETYNGKIYIFGGFGGGALTQVQIFDPTAAPGSMWSKGKNIPPGHQSGSGNSALINDKVYYCGGIQGPMTTSLCAAYDLNANTWDTNVAPMPFGRNHAATTTDGSKMYVIGGRDGGNWVANGFDEVQIYDPVTDIWVNSTGSDEFNKIPLARGGMGQAVYHDGLIYVFGGETKNGKLASGYKVFNRVDIFTIATGKWTRGEDMPRGMHGHWGVFHEGKIYIAGGGVKAAYSVSSNFFAMKV